jgi:hypothetical protein
MPACVRTGTESDSGCSDASLDYEHFPEEARRHETESIERRHSVCSTKIPASSVQYVKAALADIKNRVNGCKGHFGRTVCPRLVGKAMFRT